MKHSILAKSVDDETFKRLWCIKVELGCDWNKMMVHAADALEATQRVT